MTKLARREYDAVLRADFHSFLMRCFAELQGQTTFEPGRHLEVVASRLVAVRHGKTRRLIINVPPRHLKSLIGSVAFPAWCLGHNPAAQVMCVSYAQDLSDKHARDCRSIMTSAWYRRLFPRTRLSSLATQELVTTAGGVRLASSVGGVLTGRGADLIIIDDPIKPADALSETVRRAANEWYNNTLYSRLNDKQRGAIVLIMQRLHEDDLVGHVVQQDDWDVLSFPAIAEEDETHHYETVWGPVTFTRSRGQALHPEREPLEMLERRRLTMGKYNFAGQYQQAPAPARGGLVKADWFRRYQRAEAPQHYDQIVQSWDTANKPTELSDFSVCTTWGLKDKKLYLMDVFRERLAYPDLKRAVQRQNERYNPQVILIEDRASGTQLIQELIAEGLHGVQKCNPSGDKIMRLHAQTATIENGFVYLPAEANWVPAYLHELTVFPRGKHDDQVDSTSQFLEWFKQPMPGAGIFEFTKQLARETAARNRPPPPPPPVPARGSMEWFAQHGLD
jgi:predicted phage terminase large subunit-like protein